MKKLFIILIPILVIIVVVSQVDDEISEEANDLITRLGSKGESESYLYLYGVFASEEENPVTVGKKLLEEYRKLDDDESYNVIGYSDTKKLSLPTGDAFCSSWESECLEYLFSSPLDIESLLKEHELLVARSNEFLAFSEFTTLAKPTMHEIFAPYSYIAAAERIKVLSAISLYRQGNVEEAIDLLLLQFSQLRASMALQDNIIGKLVFLMKLSEIVDVMSLMLSTYNGDINPIPYLSSSEKSFYMIAAREFGMAYYAFNNLDRHPEFFEQGGNLPGWMTRIIYKPNMTINAITPIYSEVERLTQLSSPDFAKQIEADKGYTPTTSKLKNYMGSVLIGLFPGYNKHVARFYDFDAKLALFNQFHHSKLEFNNMKNPYYGNEEPKNVDGKLCFNGPLEDTRSLRCLRIKN